LFSAERPENKKNKLYKVYLIARATIFVTYLKPIIFRKSALLFFAVLLAAPQLSSDGWSTAKNKKKHLCVLRVSAVKTI
jgi:hypothetical protein